MDVGYRVHLIDFLAKLYRKQLAKVKVAGILSMLRKESEKVVSFSILVQHPIGDGDEGDPRWI